MEFVKIIGKIRNKLFEKSTQFLQKEGIKVLFIKKIIHIPIVLSQDLEPKYF